MYSEEKRQSMETDSKMAKMLEADRCFKTIL